MKLDAVQSCPMKRGELVAPKLEEPQGLTPGLHQAARLALIRFVP
jgi:hypothetical protein